MLICLATTLSAVACSREPFTVWFEENGGTLVSGQKTQLVTRAKQIEPPVFEREHHEFIGWDKDISEIDRDTIVKALWNERYFITFDYAPEKTIKVEPDEAIGELPQPTVLIEGKKFEFWTIDSQKIDSDDVWTWKDDKQARAVWLGEGEYWIELFYEGGSVEVQNRLTYFSSDSTFSLNNPTRKGYTFKGWENIDNPSEGLLKEVQIASGSTGHKKYKAVWEANNYTLTFNARSGDVDVLTKTVTTDQMIGELPTPTNGNVIFDGWYYNDIKLVDTDLYTLADDVELVAKWKYTFAFQFTSVVNSTTITAEVIGGNPENKEVDGDYIISSDLPPTHRVKMVKANAKEYEFYGWTINGKKFDGSSNAYPEHMTIEELLLELKGGKVAEQNLRLEMIEAGTITIIAKCRAYWYKG